MASPVQSTMGKTIDRPPVEGKVRVYFTDGTAHDCCPVDASEAVNGGEYSYTPPAIAEDDHDSRNIVASAVPAEAQGEDAEAEGKSGPGKTQGKETVSTSTARKRSKR